MEVNLVNDVSTFLVITDDVWLVKDWAKTCVYVFWGVQLIFWDMSFWYANGAKKVRWLSYEEFGWVSLSIGDTVHCSCFSDKEKDKESSELREDCHRFWQKTNQQPRNPNPKPPSELGLNCRAQVTECVAVVSVIKRSIKKAWTSEKNATGFDKWLIENPKTQTSNHPRSSTLRVLPS